MTKRNAFSRIGDVFAIFGSAAAAARAVEAGRRPHRRDLENLGIDPSAFDNMHAR